MNAEEAIKQLNNIKENLKKLQLKANRKHWRESEKVMAKASLQKDIDAIDFALRVMQATGLK